MAYSPDKTSTTLAKGTVKRSNNRGDTVDVVLNDAVYLVIDFDKGAQAWGDHVDMVNAYFTYDGQAPELITDVETIENLFNEREVSKEDREAILVSLMRYNKNIYDYKMGKGILENALLIDRLDEDEVKKIFDDYGYKFNLLDESKFVRKLCEKQKCYDLKNFAATFKRDMSNFIMKGKGQSWTLELSIPGRDNAIALLESMCNDD